MKLLILDENYPHLDNLLGDVFVHVRVKEYAKKNTVKVISFFHQREALVYEGIPVEFYDTIAKVMQAIETFKPDRILIHFYQSWMLETFIKKLNIPCIIWVHGYEALGWYRRLFNYKWYSPVLLKFIKRNTIQQYHFHQLIKFANKSSLVQFVFVSNWMKKITEQDSFKKVDNHSIIANPIDVNLFFYQKKGVEKRKKILLLRSFGSRKYANDLAAKAIMLLSKKDFFFDLEFTIIGKGQYFDSITKPLRAFKNIIIKEEIIQQVNIPDIHKSFGIFLCPTRQDAQGVSMCEAMSSGLVPITSNNTAIPEFITNMENGILTKTPNDIANAIEFLYFNPSSFLELSEKASRSICLKCSINNIVKNELQLIEKG